MCFQFAAVHQDGIQIGGNIPFRAIILSILVIIAECAMYVFDAEFSPLRLIWG